MTPASGNGLAPGFTLLELLAALAVLGLVLGALSLGFRFGLISAGTSDRLANSTADLAAADRTLRRLIEGMDPGDDSDAAPFHGSASTLDCIATMPGDDLGLQHHLRARLFVDDAHRLILRWRPYLHARPLRPQKLEDAELLANIERVDFAFWRPGAGWVSVWRSAQLPVLIRVRLTFAASDPHRWPDIVAAPQLDQP